MRKGFFVFLLLIFNSVFCGQAGLPGNSISAEFLMWSLREGGAENWAQIINPAGPNFLQTNQSIKLIEAPFKWAPGFRIGITHPLQHDKWDLSFNYTWYKTNSKVDITPSTGAVYSAFIGNFYINNTNGAGLSGPIYRSASMNWKVLFNAFDLELSRQFLIREAFHLKPYIGIKAAIVNQQISTLWHSPILASFPFTPLNFNSATENLENNFWGIGPSIGIHSSWHVVSHLNLLGDFSGAILWGRWHFKDAYQTDISRSNNIELDPITGASSMIRGLIGLEWQQKSLKIHVGYEGQIWFNMVQYYLFNGGRLNNLMSLQGGVLGFNYIFE